MSREMQSPWGSAGGQPCKPASRMREKVSYKRRRGVGGWSLNWQQEQQKRYFQEGEKPPTLCPLGCGVMVRVANGLMRGETNSPAKHVPYVSSWNKPLDSFTSLSLRFVINKTGVNHIYQPRLNHHVSKYIDCYRPPRGRCWAGPFFPQFLDFSFTPGL